MPTTLTDADKVIRNDTGISIANAITALSGVVRGGNENIGDAYNSSNSYAAGDYCIYENTLYKCTGATSGAWDSSNWTATSIADEISEVKSGLSVDSANSPSAVSVNGTYQIPQNVLNHTFIIVGARRAGRGGSVIFSKENLITFDNAFTVMADNNTGYTLKCSSTGLITLVSINGGLSEPYILVNGLL